VTSFFKYQPGAPGERCSAPGESPPKAARFIGLAAGASESYEAWHDHFVDLKQRGLSSPLLGISDGAPGLYLAYEQVFEKSLRQRCFVHRAGNLIAKVPKANQDEVKKDFWRIFNNIEAAPGEAAIKTHPCRSGLPGPS
jgi:putative transposase